MGAWKKNHRGDRSRPAIYAPQPTYISGGVKMRWHDGANASRDKLMKRTEWPHIIAQNDGKDFRWPSGA